ncbi:MAG: cysteine--tRNA ligase [Rhodospirillaceae bacterium]|nr:cysteine--tRNA ligase [Rhodospirillaceae bacterium]
MQLALYNTLSRRKEAFVPLDPGHIRMYVCGPTVYSYPHVGNARSAVVFDVLYRLLRRLYPRVTYARNITDVDDKIIAAAQAAHEPIESIATRTAAAYREDMAALGTLPPTQEPRATQYIPQMIAMIERLIARGHAYAAQGHVLFDVPSMPDYGKLARRDRDDMIAGARVEVAPYKKDPADFVLWKPSADNQPGWDSPWGRGRPGWHIECSAMGEALLGETFDIHGGGQDLMFPHHENEIAQSACAHGGAPLARYWMHNGFLSMNDEKMSKSLGNIVTVRELLADWPGEVIRLALLSAHYRAPLNWTTETLQQAKASLDRFYNALKLARDAGVALSAGEPPTTFLEALADDLNTAQALAVLHEAADSLNQANMAADAPRRRQAAARLLAGGDVFGILRQDLDAWFRWQKPGSAAADDGEIQTLIDLRLAARKARNFTEADRIRDELAARGIVLEDGAKGTTWRRSLGADPR